MRSLPPPSWLAWEVGCEISQARQSNGLFEIIRQRGFEIFPFSGARVTEPELPRVKHLARKIFREPQPIDFIAQHGMAEMVEMHTNLMGAATVKAAFNQTCLFI